MTRTYRYTRRKGGADDETIIKIKKPKRKKTTVRSRARSSSPKPSRSRSRSPKTKALVANLFHIGRMIVYANLKKIHRSTKWKNLQNIINVFRK